MSLVGATTFITMDRIVTLSIMPLGISIKRHYAACHYAECDVLFIVMLNVIMLSVVFYLLSWLNAIMLSIEMLNVIILCSVGPYGKLFKKKALINIRPDY
jgi:hypothetical protein